MKSLAVMIALPLLGCYTGGSAYACQCGGIPTVVDSLPEASAVFLGQVDRMWISAARTNGMLYPLRTFHFRVLSTWKGANDRSVVVADGGGNCDYRFKLGQVYLVVAHPHPLWPGKLATSKCLPTHPVQNGAQELQGLGEPRWYAEPLPEIHESPGRHSLRVLWTSALVGVVAVVSVVQVAICEEPFRKSLVGTALAIGATLLVVPGWRLFRYHGRKMIIAVLMLVVLGVLLVLGLGQYVLHSQPYWEDLLA